MQPQHFDLSKPSQQLWGGGGWGGEKGSAQCGGTGPGLDPQSPLFPLPQSADLGCGFLPRTGSYSWHLNLLPEAAWTE